MPQDGRFDTRGWGRAGDGMETPLDTAVEAGDAEMARYLLLRGARPYPPETRALVEANNVVMGIFGPIPIPIGPRTELIDKCPRDRLERDDRGVRGVRHNDVAQAPIRSRPDTARAIRRFSIGSSNHRMPPHFDVGFGSHVDGAGRRLRPVNDSERHTDAGVHRRTNGDLRAG